MAITSSQSWKTDFMSNYEDARRVASGRDAAANIIQLVAWECIWIIGDLVGPKNPNLDFTNFLASWFAICQLCRRTLSSTSRREDVTVMPLYDDFMPLYIARVYDLLDYGMPRITRTRVSDNLGLITVPTLIFTVSPSWLS
jgi:hypothetical protein